MRHPPASPRPPLQDLRAKRLVEAGRRPPAAAPLSPSRFKHTPAPPRPQSPTATPLAFVLSPSAERLEEIATSVLDYAVRSAVGLPTLAYKASGHWKAAAPASGKGGPHDGSTTYAAAAVPVRPAPSHQHRSLPVNAREDVLQTPSAEWLVTGKQTLEWAAADAVLPALSLDHPQVAFARQLIADVVRDNATDAQVIADLFEPFSYLLTEAARLDTVLGGAVAAANDAAAAAAQAALQGSPTDGGGVMDVAGVDASFASPVHLLSVAMSAPQALTLEECDRLLRQYSTTIALLERAIPDLQVGARRGGGGRRR